MRSAVRKRAAPSLPSSETEVAFLPAAHLGELIQARKISSLELTRLYLRRLQEADKKLAQNIEKKGEVMGPRANKKTMLAKQVLQELNVGGRVSKKTQLAVDDAAREATEAPLPT